jgi:hypothetical protein
MEKFKKFLRFFPINKKIGVIIINLKSALVSIKTAKSFDVP